jgi:HEAT repeat protein
MTSPLPELDAKVSDAPLLGESGAFRRKFPQSSKSAARTARRVFSQLSNLSPDLRFCAMQKLVSTRSELTREILRLLLKLDRSVLVRHEAAFALANFADPRDITALGRALSGDPSPLVRHEAALALGVFRRPASKKMLRRGYADPSSMVAQSCRAAIRMSELAL